MSKKQTSNTFGKGLVQDLHPLIVPNDTLTDALNATTVTMNGNEGILQNDMGNGRVESAFLPPGYVPVGIKEYGGIIYVASYNPITNKGQIGSFPSPERNIDQDENGDLKNPLDLLNQDYTRTYKFSEFNKLEDCRIGLGELTNKTEIFGDYKVIRSGDKFGFYFDDDKIQNDRNILSNYFNFDLEDNLPSRGNNKSVQGGSLNQYGGWDKVNGVYQNNIVTLSTQVLDSNNNLRDLTHQLKRYGSNNEVLDFKSDQVTESDRFNSGYFISSGPNQDWDLVNKERNKKALNTYNNKLFGRLYLVGTVNVVDHIEVQIQPVSGSKCYMFVGSCDENTKNLFFYIDYYYNCPLNYLYEPKIYYHTERTGIIELSNNNITVSPIVEADENDPNELHVVGYEPPTYDVYTNLYRYRYVAYIDYTNFIDESVESNILNFIVIPQMCNLPGESENKRSYTKGTDIITKLTHIAAEGSIDLSKIGSGTCEIVQWRYLYLDNRMNITWGLEDYPLDTDIIENMRMEFYDLNEDGNILRRNNENNIEVGGTPKYVEYINKISYNGTFTTSLTFGSNTIQKRHIYLVRFVRDKNDTEEAIGWRVLITTPIYNSLYTTVDDYNKPNDNNIEAIIQDLNKVNIDININETSSSNTNLKRGNIQLHIKNNNVFEESTYKFTPIKIGNSDDNTYSYIEYTSFETTKTLKVNLNISDNYPFELTHPEAIDYDMKVQPSIESNELENKIGSDSLPVFEGEYDPITGENLSIENIEKKCENIIPGIGSQTPFCGNSQIIVKNKYNFPSELIFKYESGTRTINVNNRYIDLSTFIQQELPNEILIPICAIRDKTGSTVCYSEAAKYQPGGSYMERVINSSNSSIIDKDNDNLNYEFISSSAVMEGENGLKNIFSVLGFSSSNFVIVGSPLTFGHPNCFDGQTDRANILDFGFDIVKNVYSNYRRQDAYANFMLRKKGYEYNNQLYYINGDGNDREDENNLAKRFNEGGPSDNEPRARYGYKNWFLLLWKDTKDSFVILNNIYTCENKINNTPEYLSPVLKSYNMSYSDAVRELFKDNNDNNFSIADRIFFKLKEPWQTSGHVIDVSGCTYNQDYNVTLSDSIELQHITFKTIQQCSNIVKYYEGNREVERENDEGVLKVESELKAVLVNDDFENIKSQIPYLKFELTKNSSPKTSSSKTYKITGLSNFVSNLVISSQLDGLIEFNGGMFAKDDAGDNIIEDIYYFKYDNGGYTLLKSTEVSDDIHSEFIKSLAVRNDKLVVQKITKGTSKDYGFSCGDRPGRDFSNDGWARRDGTIVLLIGQLPYIDFTSDNSSNRLFNTQ